MQDPAVQAHPATDMTVPLTAHLIRFTVQAESMIAFHDFKGSALRGAFAGTLRQAFCAEAQRRPLDPFHRALCPACQLLDAEAAGNEHGDIRRPYTIRPPLDDKRVYAPGECFSFEMVLFGDKLSYFPYLVMTVQRMGIESGVGIRAGKDGRGRFSIRRVEAVNPLTGDVQILLETGANTVQMPAVPVTHSQVNSAAERLEKTLALRSRCLTVRLQTPLRLMQGGHLVDNAAFFPLAKQIVLRVLDLCTQHAGGRPDIHLKRDVYPFADTVVQIEDHTSWWDLKGYSGRLERSQALGGMVGHSIYYSENWAPLLPWLIWGEIVQVGKNIVKGCGIYTLEVH